MLSTARPVATRSGVSGMACEPRSPYTLVDGAEVVVEVAALSGAVDGLSGVDLSAVPAQDLPDLLRDLKRASTRLGAVQTRVLGEMQRRQAYTADGHCSARDWLTGELLVDPRQASREAKLARDLRDMPKLADAFAEGDISQDHVQVVASAINQADPADREDTEADLLATARTVDPGTLRRQVRRRRIRQRPKDAAAAERQAFEQRAARYVEKPDGGATFIAELTPGDYEVHRTARHAHLTSDPTDLPEPQRRSFAQRLYDAEMEITRRTLTADQVPTRNGAPATGTVIVPLEILAADEDEPAEPAQLGFAGPVTADTARRLLCDAHICRLVVGPRSQPLDVGPRPTQRDRRAGPGADRHLARLRTVRRPARVRRDPPHRLLGQRRPHRPRTTCCPCAGPATPPSTMPDCTSAGGDDGSVTFVAPDGTRHRRTPPAADRGGHGRRQPG